MDLIFVGIVVAFFAASAGLIRFCANLMTAAGPRQAANYFTAGGSAAAQPQARGDQTSKGRP